MSTNALSAKDIKRNWHLVDAKDQILGRISVEIVAKLSGKNKVNYVPYLDMGDYVVVINASKVKVTGKKAEQKEYVRHSGYPGGKKVENFSHLLKRKPDQVIRHAVKGMLPKNKLADRMLKKLFIFEGTNHPYKQAFNTEDSNKKQLGESNG